MKTCFRIGLLAACLATHEVHAKDIEVNGRLQTGVESEGLQNWESYYNGRLEIETDRKKGYKGVFEISAKSANNEVVPLDAFIDRKFDDETHLRFGQQKTRFGLEYLYSNSERVTVERNLAYKKLDVFGYTGRQINIMYFGDGEHLSGFTHSVGFSEANDASLVSSYRHDLGDHWGVGVFGLLVSDRVDAGRQVVWANEVGVWKHEKHSRFEWEIFSGQDPVLSQFEAQFGDNKKVFFASNKLLYAQELWKLDDGELEGVVSQATIIHDVENYRYNTLSGLMGITYKPHKDLRFAINAELIGSNSFVDLTTRSYDQSRAQIEAKYYW